MGIAPSFHELEDRHLRLALGFEAATVGQFTFEPVKKLSSSRYRSKCRPRQSRAERSPADSTGSVIHYNFEAP
jgi:hypothetical protein